MTNRSRRIGTDASYVAHAIHVTRPEVEPPGHTETRATVECQVKGRTQSVTHCQQCERFKRVEVQEGAYVLVCRVGSAEQA